MVKQLVICALFILSVNQGIAQSSEIFQTKEGIAIKGYDPVAFFLEQKPVKGSDSFRLEWKSAIWLFSTAAHRELFRNDPEKYAPQYGGYCAYGVAGNHKSPTETDTWTISGGRLFFNYNQSVKNLWLKDSARLILKADSLWQDIRIK